MQRLWKAIVAIVLIVAISLPLTVAALKKPDAEDAGQAASVKRDYTYDVQNVLPEHPLKTFFAPLRFLHRSKDIDEIRRMTGTVVSEYLSMIAGGLLMGIAEILPSRNWATLDSYESKNFYKGTEKFADEATAESWKAGYASASYIPQEVRDGKTDGYFLAGYFNNKKVTGVTEGDDQLFNAVALDAGAGTVLFCGIDGFGLTNADIRTIRASLTDFAREKGIIGINISVSHSHYCLDIHGTGANMMDMMKKNFAAVPGGITKELQSKNQTLMDTLFRVGKETIMNAVNNMEPGKLSYGSVNVQDILRDKQDPDVFDPEAHRIRFMPDNAQSKEIWLINLGLHPVTMNGDTTTVSADYVGKVVKLAKEKAGAQVAFFQGAESAISRKEENIPGYNKDSTDIERITLIGGYIIDRIMAIPAADEIPLEPILNFRSREIFLPIDNPLMMALLKLQLANNVAVTKQKDKTRDTYIVTEIGYCEFGKSLAVGLVPCELSPEIAFGGAKPAKDAWNESDWQFAPMQDLTGGRKLIMFGLMNDQFGYVIPDNDHAPFLTDTFGNMGEINDEDLPKSEYKFKRFSGNKNDHYEELLSLGPDTASTMMLEFNQMIGELR